MLIVDVYHEFDQPRRPGSARLATALKPSGRIGIVDFNKAGGGPGPATDERVDETTVIDEAQAAGLHCCGRRRSCPFST